MGTEQATGVKVFSCTLARDREALGDVITRWIADHPGVEIIEKQVRQSSDRQFHCLSVTVFYRDRKGE
jgi:folate-dependent tRNA-U54 methylase TrmFO/GidA